jgi:hypothetical protein
MPNQDDLNEFFAKAVSLGQENKFPKNGKILIVDSLENFFKSRLNCKLLESNRIEEDLFECTDYIAKILAGFIRDNPRKIMAAEYFAAFQQYRQDLEGDNPIRPEDFLAQGGQACFVICVFFPVFNCRRLVDAKYYAQMGATFFYQYFLETAKPVANAMAEHFDELVPLTREAIAD